MPRRRTNNANSRVCRERRLAEQQQQQQQMAEPTAEPIHPMSEADQLALAVAASLTDDALHKE